MYNGEFNGGFCKCKCIRRSGNDNFKPGVGRWISRRNWRRRIFKFFNKSKCGLDCEPQILKRSKGFTKKAGSIIYINLKIFPHKKVRIGVIKGGKVKKYYEVTTGLEKEIPVKDTDTYSVFVQNMTNSTINAKGSYIK